MKLLLPLLTFLFAAQSVSADCSSVLHYVIKTRDHLFSSMLDEEKGILAFDRAFFYIRGKYGESHYAFVISKNSIRDSDVTTTTTEVTLSPALFPVYIVANSASSSSDATSRKISVSEIENVYELLLEANIGSGKQLQAFNQSLKDEGISATSENTAKIIADLDQSDAVCQNGAIPDMGDVKNAVLYKMRRNNQGTSKE